MQPRYAADFLLKVSRAFTVHRSFKITHLPGTPRIWGGASALHRQFALHRQLFYFSGEVHSPATHVGELGWFGGL